ncbi:MAG: PP2C family protein-serine/threonine phosphatase [Saezia sp.]
MKFNFSIQTRRGGRKKNEDRADHTQTEHSSLFILADGMGGHPDGEIAAEIAIRTMIEMFHKETKLAMVQDPIDFLQKSLRTAHHRIIRYGTEQGLLDVPRSTAVACLLQNGKAWWGNCGDSRLYLVRNFRLLAHTADHSFVSAGQRNIDLGRKVVVEGAAEISRSALYSCLGGMALPEIDVTGPIVLEANDRILLCSDGLWSAMTQEKVVALLSSNTEIRSIATNLVQSALLAAGKDSDNVTLIAIEWMPPENSEHGRKSQKTLQSGFKDMFSDQDDLRTNINAIKTEMDAIIKRISDLD